MSMSWWYVDIKFARRIDLRRANNLINWSIISSTSSSIKSLTKKSNLKILKNLKFWLASRTCDEQNFRLIEIEIRVSNSNWLQRFLFWTNWIQLNQRLKFDWSSRKAQRKYFYLYVVQVLFWIVFFFPSEYFLAVSRRSRRIFWLLMIFNI